MSTQDKGTKRWTTELQRIVVDAIVAELGEGHKTADPETIADTFFKLQPSIVPDDHRRGITQWTALSSWLIKRVHEWVPAPVATGNVDLTPLQQEISKLKQELKSAVQNFENEVRKRESLQRDLQEAYQKLETQAGEIGKILKVVNVQGFNALLKRLSDLEEKFSVHDQAIVVMQRAVKTLVAPPAEQRPTPVQVNPATPLQPTSSDMLAGIAGSETPLVVGKHPVSGKTQLPQTSSPSTTVGKALAKAGVKLPRVVVVGTHPRQRVTLERDYANVLDMVFFDVSHSSSNISEMARGRVVFLMTKQAPSDQTQAVKNSQALRIVNCTGSISGLKREIDIIIKHGIPEAVDA